MNKKTWIIFAVVVIALLAGLVIYSRNASPKTNVDNIDANAIQVASAQNGNIADHVSGKTDSKVILTEYGDFQCPYCGQAYQPLKSVTDQYKGQVAFVFRNFPLTTMHPNALAAASAAEAAGLQGKYWEFHDLLYQNQSSWQNLTGDDRTNAYVAYAQQLGLNTGTFKTDLGSVAVSDKISFDKALGSKLKIDSTPSFYLDGQLVSSDISSKLVQGDTSGLITLINAQLTANNIALPTSTH